MKKLRIKPKINQYVVFVYRKEKRISIVCPNNIIIDGSFIEFIYDSKNLTQCIRVLETNGHKSLIYVKNYDRVKIMDMDTQLEFKTVFKLEFQYYMNTMCSLKGMNNNEI